MPPPKHGRHGRGFPHNGDAFSTQTIWGRRFFLARKINRFCYFINTLLNTVGMHRHPGDHNITFGDGVMLEEFNLFNTGFFCQLINCLVNTGVQF